MAKHTLKKFQNKCCKWINTKGKQGKEFGGFGAQIHLQEIHIKIWY
jgi:hypothetical protein